MLKPATPPSDETYVTYVAGGHGSSLKATDGKGQRVRLRKTLHKQTRHITRSLVMLCIIPSVAVGALSLHYQSPPVTALSALMLPVILLAWRIYRSARRLQSHVHSQAEAAEAAQQHYFGVLSQMMAVIEGRDRFLAGRSERIAILTGQIATRLGLDKERAILLGMVARVHDIGLLAVPPEILSKATGLSGAEYGVIKKHCQVGCHMLQPLTFLHPVLDAVLYHHERMNGTGYPDELTADQIPIEARIMAVADSYDAMTHDRPHRGSLSHRRAVAELIRCADVGYDRDCVAALAAIVAADDLIPDHWSDDEPKVNGYAVLRPTSMKGTNP